MTRTIDDTHKDHLILINDDGTIDMVSNDEYFDLKFSPSNIDHRDDEGRIFHEFTHTQKIHETYNQRIFNLMFNNHILQTRQEEANKVCMFIINNDIKSFLKYCEDKYQIINCQDILKKILFVYADRLKFGKAGVIVDDSFRIKYDGGAMYRRNNRWHSLCLVVDGYIRDKMVDTAVGKIHMSRTLQTIMGKIGFCLKPNIKDSVFMNQLPDNLKKCLIDEWTLKEKELNEKKKREEAKLKQQSLDEVLDT